ncbi:TetR/AcrR family transcriptional regulator [Pseudorhodoplanes sinuspersici]|uniref:TetR family transcriptional regulator n=1 Tax=Pseudorhodoplanes sinuspersici TaxID=1235591 RepID=A0A1W6ZXT1_9HYPH|nr:TetR/AcrR family transcriptional regulator [Pseudorhodoplanes sinuspersici]ARQ02192.1 TetR family transcriptional regulator [Pseudorhodoplanes sinuspersici]RKE74008.1 TetR family transcriptional regulator [Pseudorhodoplanes sinuspersici]
MKVSREQAEKNRRRIVEVAGEMFREHGFDGIGLADLMKKAGLTHGGFYGHFKSKEALAAEASARALSKSCDKLAAVADAASGDALAALVGSYLSDRHRKEIGKGCAFVALGADAARHGKPLRSAFAKGVDDYLAVLSDIVPGRTKAEKRKKAMTTLSGMVGALVLARAVDDENLAKEILVATAASLTAPTVGNV